MTRKINSNYVCTPARDAAFGWDDFSLKPIFSDPIIDMTAWDIPGGRWDLHAATIHGDIGILPVLMSDGHVKQFDRTPFSHSAHRMTAAPRGDLLTVVGPYTTR